MIGYVEVPLTGGVNTFNDPSKIQDDQLQLSQNISARVGEFSGARAALQPLREINPDGQYALQAINNSGSLAPNSYSSTQQEWEGYWAKAWKPMKFMFSPFGGEVVAVLRASEACNILDVGAGGDPTATVQRTINQGESILWMSNGAMAGYGSGLGTSRGGVATYIGAMDRPSSLFIFNGVIYAFGGGTPGARIVPGGGGYASLTTGVSRYVNQFINGRDGTPQLFIPDGGAPVRDRIVYWKGGTLYWSDRNQPLSVMPDVNNNGVAITGEELEPITCVAELSTTADGSPTQSVAAAFTKTHCYLLLGEPVQSIDDLTNGTFGSLQLNKLNIQAGCVAANTLVRTPYGTIWMGKDDVWFMPFGSLPQRIGTNIRDQILAQPPSLMWRCCAEYQDGFYRLSMFAEGQGPNADSPLQMQWWLDLNGGPPQSADDAEWWGPQILNNKDVPIPAYAVSSYDPTPYYGMSGIYAMARDTRPASDGRIYVLQPYVMPLGDGANLRYGMTLCGWDQQRGRDCGAPIMEYRAWQATTQYAVGDIIVPTPSTGLDQRAPAFICTSTGGGGSSGSTEPNWYASGAGIVTDGSITWQSLVTYSSGGFSWAGTAYRANAQQQGNETSWKIVSKEYTLGDPMVEKLLDGMEMAYWSQIPIQVTYSCTPDRQTRARLLGQYGSALDATANSFDGQRVWQRKLLTSDPTKRFNSQSGVAIITQNPGFVIVTGFNDTLRVKYGGVSKTITIPAGYYPGLASSDTTGLVAAIQQAAFLTAPLDTTVTDLDGDSLIRAVVGLSNRLGTLQLDVYTVLAGYLGYTPAQAGGTTVTAGNYLYGARSPFNTQETDFQFAGLKIRFGAFGRRPQ